MNGNVVMIRYQSIFILGIPSAFDLTLDMCLDGRLATIIGNASQGSHFSPTTAVGYLPGCFVKSLGVRLRVHVHVCGLLKSTNATSVQHWTPGGYIYMDIGVCSTSSPETELLSLYC